jgi:hypothetical protein
MREVDVYCKQLKNKVMKFLAPIILLVITALFTSHEGEEMQVEITTAGQDTITVTHRTEMPEPAGEEDTEKYGELVETPGLLNRITIFGY